LVDVARSRKSHVADEKRPARPGDVPASPFTHLFRLPSMLQPMDARTPTTRIPGYSRARLKRIIAVGNIVAMAIGLWTILLPTHFYALVVSLCFLLPICALALPDGL